MLVIMLQDGTRCVSFIVQAVDPVDYERLYFLPGGAAVMLIQQGRCAVQYQKKTLSLGCNSLSCPTTRGQKTRG